MSLPSNSLCLSRRSFLAGTAAASAATALRPCLARAATNTTFLSARSDEADNAFAAIFDDTGAIHSELPLAARGHGAAQHPQTRDAILFARRPGYFFIVLDPVTGAARATIEAAPNRHFNGHGIFSADGTRLFTTETVSDSGDGMIGIYDPAAGYARIGEFASGGLDPHDLRLLPDGMLVVANGGILTDPAAPGVKLNIDTMDSSLAILQPRDGTTAHAFRLDAEPNQLSLRHLALASDGGVAVAMQYEGPDLDRVALVAYLAPGAGGLVALDPPAPVLRKLDHYCGSAASDGNILAVSSPRGGCAAFWDMTAQRFLGTVDLADGCGIAPTGIEGEFLFSSGLGGMLRCEPDALATDTSAVELLHDVDTSSPTLRWDNHILRLV
jgi:hypothetical protein